MSTSGTLNHRGSRPSIRATGMDRRRVPWSFIGFGVVAYATLAFVFSIAPVPAPAFVCSIALGALCLVPIFLWYHKGWTGAPAFEMICLSFAIAYSLPVFFVPHEIVILSKTEELPWSTVEQAQLLTLGGLVVLILGFFWTRRSPLFALLPSVDLPLAGRSLDRFLAWAFVIGGTARILSMMVGIDSRFGAVLTVASIQFEVGIVLLAYRVFRGGPGRRLLYSMLALTVLLGLTSGMLSRAFVPLAIIWVVRWHVTRRFPVWLVLVLFAAFMMLNAVKAEFRERAWYGDASSRNPVARLQVWWEVMRDQFAGKGPEPLTTDEPAWRKALARVDLLHKFTHVLMMTPSEVPYFRGDTYRYMLYTLVPRLFWPDKPIATDSTDRVDFAYGLRTPAQTGVKISIGMLAEAYANFGVWGVFVVMAIQGVIFGLLDRMLNGLHSHGGRALYVVIMVAFLNGIGTNAVILFGNIFQMVAVSSLLLLFFSGTLHARRLNQPPR